MVYPPDYENGKNGENGCNEINDTSNQMDTAHHDQDQDEQSTSSLSESIVRLSHQMNKGLSNLDQASKSKKISVDVHHISASLFKDKQLMYTMLPPDYDDEETILYTDEQKH